jgi:hypothetical protein
MKNADLQAAQKELSRGAILVIVSVKTWSTIPHEHEHEHVPTNTNSSETIERNEAYEVFSAAC